MQMLIRKLRHAAPSRRARQKPDLHQIRLIHILERYRLFSDRRRQRFQSHGTSAIVADNRRQHSPVNGVQPQMVDLQLPQRVVGSVLRDDAVVIHLRKIAHTAQKPVCNAGRAS